jgi:hypothetical protein
VLFPPNVYGLDKPTVPVRITERLVDVVLESVQKAPRWLFDNVGTESELNPVLVILYTVEKSLDVRASDVPDTFDVIQRYSVGP